MKINVYVAAHKPYDLVKKYLDDTYTFIQVGQVNKAPIEGFLSDHDADLISHKNDTYSELTALYYIWKKETADYVGLVHYRRLFSGKRCTLFKYQALNKAAMEALLKVYDAILPKQVKLRRSAYEQYQRNHYIKDLDVTKTILKKKYPDYVDSFDQVMQGKKMFYYNMFIMRKDLVDQYAKFLFDILFELERRIDISMYDSYQRRVFGFISERLFNVWMKKNKVHFKEVPAISIELNPFKEGIKEIGRMIFGASGDVKR